MNGSTEPYRAEQLRRALQKSGANRRVAAKIMAVVESELYPGIPTKDIYRMAFQLLESTAPQTAARYSLKRAIMELGPTGFPFERFVGALLKGRGYDVQVGVLVNGTCVQHEIDVLAEKENEIVLFECKYHNRSGESSDVKIPLYVQSRFLDVTSEWIKRAKHVDKTHVGGVVTNTRLTDDAIKYGNCVGLRLWAWDYPHNEGIKDFIDRTGLYPLTCLTALTKREKELLIQKGLVLCKDVFLDPVVLQSINISPERAERILRDCKGLSGASEAATSQRSSHSDPS